MSVIPPLTSSPLNLIALREEERKFLVGLLSKIPGNKCVILNMQLSKPLMMVTEDVSTLKNCGVTNFHHLDTPITTIKEENAIFFVRPSCDDIKLAAKTVLKFQEDEKIITFHFFFFPCVTRITREMMRDKNIYDICKIVETTIDIFPFDDDILSLEWFNGYSNLFLHNDYTLLHITTNALMRIQSLYGVIPKVTAIGINAQAVVDMMIQRRAENKEKEMNLPPEIDRLIVIDRSVDSVTPFVVPLTYEGLIDEILSIECGVIISPDSNPKSDKKIQIRLNSSDTMYQELRDENIGTVIRMIGEIGKQVKAEADTRPISSCSMNELVEYKQKLPDIIKRRKFFEVHVNLVSTINLVSKSDTFHKRWEIEHGILAGEGNFQEILDLGDLGTSFTTVIRLLILQCQVNNGLPPKEFNTIRREIVQMYGFDKVVLMNHLKELHLLFPKENAGNFSTLRSRMRLVQDGIDGSNTNDMSYITSGYAPLSGRLVQAILTQGGLSQEIVKILNSPVKEVKQVVSCPQRDTGMKKKIALVVFVGGMTYTEVASMRQLKHLEDIGYEIVMLTSHLTNGAKLLQDIMDDIPLIPLPPKQN